MSAEASETLTQIPASAEVRAERKRAMDALTIIINDCLTAWQSIAHPVAEELVRGFCRELVGLNRFIRTGAPLESFAASRAEHLPLAEELKDT